MLRKFVVAAAAALLLCGSVGALAAAERPVDRVLAAQSQLSFALIRELADGRGKSDNLVVSPASLAAVLALLDLGADQPMRAALSKTLGFDGDRPNAATDLQNLRALVTELGNGVSDEDTKLSLANWIVFDPKSAPVDEALEKLRTAGARVSLDNLSDPATIRAINDWVSEKTNGLIPSIIDQPPQMPGLVGLNALYFKGAWSEPFAKSATHSEPFHLLTGSEFDVQMMHKLVSPVGFRQQGRFAAIDLPYRNSRFSLVVVTTTDRPAAAGEFAGVASWLQGERFSEQRVQLSLPRFTIEDKNEMLDALDALGLKAGRTSPTALAGLARNLDSISAIKQRTYLRVDEEGSEAAAATAVVVTRSAAPVGEIVSLKVDKPFLFALRDRETGFLLMSGYVVRPAPVKTAAQ